MKVLSLFDGISCGMVALERAGIPVERYVAYEIDENAIKISKKNYPQIEHCGDVTTADFTQYKDFDLLIGGSPCQSLSIVQSKTRKHLDGKSKLFFEFVRAKEEMQPKYFLFENVASMNDESKSVMSQLLGCLPMFIDSAKVSAQKRERYYWTNLPFSNDLLDLFRNECKSKLVLKDVLESNVDEKYFYNCEFDLIDENKPVVAKLHINGHDILKRVNSPNFKCPTLTTCGGGNTQKKVYINGRCRKLTPIEYERLQTLPDNYTAGVADSHRYTTCGNGWTVDVIAHIFKGLAERNEKEKPQKVIEIVQKWSDEHPAKTLLDDLKEKYPNYQKSFKDGTPSICPYKLGYEDSGNCPADTCKECWNRPLEEVMNDERL